MADDIVVADLPRGIKDTLIANGFRSSREFLDVGQIQLAKELSCSIDEASSIKRQVELACRVAARIETRPSSLAGGTYESAIQTPGMGQSVSSESETSALSILEHKAMSPCKGVITFCQALDELLGGAGAPLGEVLELCGSPGVGKTQLCMQLAVDATMPLEVGGTAGQAIYIDTEGSFLVDRVSQMARSLADHCQGILRGRVRSMASELGHGADHSAVDPVSSQLSSVADKYTAADILSRVHRLRACDAAELCAAVRCLPALATRCGGGVRLLVVDSLAFHFRHDERHGATRARALAETAAHLHSFARTHNVAVVVTNQMTTRLTSASVESSGVGLAPGAAKGGHSGALGVTGDGHRNANERQHGQGSGTSHAVLVPALGEAWSHACTHRMLLCWRRGVRVARLVKSARLPAGAAVYSVTPDGIRRPQAAKRRKSSSHTKPAGEKS